MEYIIETDTLDTHNFSTQSKSKVPLSDFKRKDVVIYGQLTYVKTVQPDGAVDLTLCPGDQ